MRKLVIYTLLLLSPVLSPAQFTLSKGNSYVEFSGALVTFYNYRFYPAGSVDHHKNTFAPDVMEFQMKGIYQKNIRYNFDLNFAALVPSDSTLSSYYIDGGVIREAYVSYTGLRKFADFKVGYMKLPFSRSSITEFDESPFLQRGEVARGNVFSRRDAGIQLSREFMNRRINVYAGAYSGLGAGSLSGDNDPSGMLQYIGRIDFAWPGRYRYSEFDKNRSPLPVLAVGVNAMYEEKKTSNGADYLLQYIDGKKTGYGIDADFKFKGICAHFEALQFRFVPNDKDRLMGKPTDYFLAGGIIASINYYWKRTHTVFAARYDELNPNDLVPGDTQRTLSFAVNYEIDNTNSCIKVHYWYHLDNTLTHEPWATDQLRVAYQLMF